MKDSAYYKQAELLLKVLPIINMDKDFALKGGTAINFFIRNLPRLSVDIDLVYLPLQDREETLSGITTKLRSIADKVRANIKDSKIIERQLKGTKYISGMQVNANDAGIKIEPNTVIRGSVYSPETFTLCDNAEDLFELSVKTQCLSLADLYGGKICAALDRQHPRDLFDVKLLLANEGFTEEIRKAFLVYLISHPRPIVELLNPNLNDISDVYHKEFVGMTNNKVELKDLTDAFNELVTLICSHLTKNEKEFLLSFKKKQPKWDLLELKGIAELPSVKWKIINLEKMEDDKHEEAYKKLEELLR